MDIRQRQVIPKQERQSIVFILDVKRPPDILRSLMNEAKHTLIRARHRLDRLKLQAKRFPLAPDKCDLPLLRPNRSPAPDASSLELKIDHIEKRLAVQFVNLVAWLQPDTFGDRPRVNRQHA